MMLFTNADGKAVPLVDNLLHGRQRLLGVWKKKIS